MSIVMSVGRCFPERDTMSKSTVENVVSTSSKSSFSSRVLASKPKPYAELLRDVPLEEGEKIRCSDGTRLVVTYSAGDKPSPEAIGGDGALQMFRGQIKPKVNVGTFARQITHADEAVRLQLSHQFLVANGVETESALEYADKLIEAGK